MVRSHVVCGRLREAVPTWSMRLADVRERGKNGYDLCNESSRKPLTRDASASAVVPGAWRTDGCRGSATPSRRREGEKSRRATSRVAPTLPSVTFGHNAELMAACAPLRGGAGRLLDQGCPVRSGAEVKDVIITGWDQGMMLRMVADENMRKGEAKGRRETAANMLGMGDPVKKVAACCGLGEEEVRAIAEADLAPA